METALLLAAVLQLSHGNGAYDNFKSVATLLGSGTTDYRRALVWTTLATFVGSVLAASLGTSLVQKFSGTGLIADTVAVAPHFLTAVAIGAAAIVLAATLLGLPISTTHALTGGLLGAALQRSPNQINFASLASGFLAPLLVSPLLALIATGLLYPLFRYARLRAGVDKETCVCIGATVVEVVSVPAVSESLFASPVLQLSVAPEQTCVQRYRGRVLGLSLQTVLDNLHYLSAGVVSFARGLNDTPKIAALLVATHALGAVASSLVVGLAMAAGGWLQARKVAETMSYRITGMNHGQGFTANLVTSGLVVLASRWGLPVSTTHVSCGSLFGIGLVSGQANYRSIAGILLAWCVTLPAAALLSFVAAAILS